VFSSPIAVGVVPRMPMRVWRTLKMVSPSLPQPASPGQLTGIFDTRSVSVQSGSDWLTS
jgi:hypothetical protein